MSSSFNRLQPGNMKVLELVACVLLISLVQRISSDKYEPPTESDYEYIEYPGGDESDYTQDIDNAKDCKGTGPVITNKKCETCRCNNGKVLCTKVSCEAPYLQPGCKMVTQENSCCPEMECVQVTRSLPLVTSSPECIGTGPIHSNNKCEICRCENKEKVCSPVSCPQPYLQPGCRLVERHGECCKEMECDDPTTLDPIDPPECSGNTHITSDDKCKICRCLFGKITCEPVKCERFYLKPGCKKVDVPGQCCPEMKCEVPPTPKPECIGNVPVPSKDKCQTCQCSYGKITCRPMKCEQPYLEPNCHLVNVPGQCCPEMKCDITTTPAPECRGNGLIPSKDKCKTCRCSYGKINCIPLTCDRPYLEAGCKLVNVRGQCCPQVQCEKPPECTGSGELESEYECETCQCVNRKKVCTEIKCPKQVLRPGCQMVSVPGECCPTMKCVTTPPECHDSDIIEPENDCETCRCVKGKTVCTPIQCTTPYLRPGCQMVDSPNECCPIMKCVTLPPTPPPECRGGGPVPSKDKCKTCRCSYGKINCSPITCDRPDLQAGCKLINVPGECCPQMRCTTSPPSECSGSGPVNSEYECKTCRCVSGKIVCTDVTCPTIKLQSGCKMVNIPGECCPTMKCVTKPPTPPPECSGNGPVPSKDKCETCKCSYGKIICSAITCDRPYLQTGCKLINIPGECCPQVQCVTKPPTPPPECSGNSPVPSKDKCKTCKCSYGKINCSPITCDRPYLQTGCKLINVHGECCPQVQCVTKPPTPPPECSGNGLVPSKNKCETCRCYYGKIKCETVECDRPQLDRGCKLVSVPGQCCPEVRCVTPAPPPAECSDSEIFQTENDCETCECVFGKIVCTPIDCPQLKLLPGCHAVKSPNHCCPTMECECSGSGLVPSKNKCETCRCSYGKIKCETEKCDRPQLDRGCTLASVPGQCCPEVRCVTPAPPPPECNGNGPVTSKDKCKTCRCVYGRLSCSPISCPQPYLEAGCKLVNKPDQCCPQVECNSPPPVEKECRGYGPVKSDNVCETCKCNNGKVFCSPILCSTPKLEPGCKLENVRGECCPQMKCDPPPESECHGTGLIPSSDICEECICVYGRKKCQRHHCPRLEQRGPNCKIVHKEGCCCPEYECTESRCIPGMYIPSHNPCESCRCIRGKVECAKQRCQPAPSPNCRIISNPSSCCPEYDCEDTHLYPITYRK